MLRQFFILVAIAWPFVTCDVSRTVAEDDVPKAGKSKVVVASFLKRVERFRRKVVFFNKDIDLPFLQVPDAGSPIHDFFERVNAYQLPDGHDLFSRVAMTKDGDLVFLNPRTIFRVNKAGSAEKLVSLAELKVVGTKTWSEGFHFDYLFGVSTVTNVLYVSISNEPEHELGVVFTKSGSYYLGKLDLAARQVLAVPYDGIINQIAINPDAALVYQIHDGSIECKDFDGKLTNSWSRPGIHDSLCLAPDRQTILFSVFSQGGFSLLLQNDVSLLDLKSGHQTNLPIVGRAPVWGLNQTIYYLVEKERDNGILDTSLFRFRVGEQRPARLFFVSCQRVKRRDSLLGSKPSLSGDYSWFAWELPVEDYHESGTVLLDITNNEYRIINGRWEGVQW